MKKIVLLTTAFAMFGSIAASAQDNPAAAAVVQAVKTKLAAADADVAAIVAAEVAANPQFAAEIVQAAIQATNADPANVAAIVTAAVTAAPSAAPAITAAAVVAMIKESDRG